MNSTDERAQWLDRHRDVAREVRPDPADANAKLNLAERNLERARRYADADPDLALVAAESALVNVADAVLARAGLRLRGKTGPHEAFMRKLSPLVTTTVAWWRTRSSSDAVVTVSGKKRPHSSNGRWWRWPGSFAHRPRRRRGRRAGLRRDRAAREAELVADEQVGAYQAVQDLADAVVGEAAVQGRDAPARGLRVLPEI